MKKEPEATIYRFLEIPSFVSTNQHNDTHELELVIYVLVDAGYFEKPVKQDDGKNVAPARPSRRCCVGVS